MNTIHALADVIAFNPLNPEDWLRLFGDYAVYGVWFILFAETGLMIGFFLPGDSLLITAGLFAFKGDLNIWTLNIALVLAAIIGDATGYYIGRRTGQALYSRPNSLLFRRDHLIKTHEFYEKHGGKTIIIARFMPIVRTFAPVVAGARSCWPRGPIPRGHWPGCSPKPGVANRNSPSWNNSAGRPNASPP